VYRTIDNGKCGAQATGRRQPGGSSNKSEAAMLMVRGNRGILVWSMIQLAYSTRSKARGEKEQILTRRQSPHPPPNPAPTSRLNETPSNPQQGAYYGQITGVFAVLQIPSCFFPIGLCSPPNHAAAPATHLQPQTLRGLKRLLTPYRQLGDITCSLA
jgi:hypothetical protein